MSLPIFHTLGDAPKPVAPYSHAVEIDGWIYLRKLDPAQPSGTGNRRHEYGHVFG